MLFVSDETAQPISSGWLSNLIAIVMYGRYLVGELVIPIGVGGGATGCITGIGFGTGAGLDGEDGEGGVGGFGGGGFDEGGASLSFGK